MKSGALIHTLCALASTATAIHLQERSDAAPRVLKFDLQRNKIHNPIVNDRSRFRRRDSTVSVDLENEISLYAANITLGTPAQDITVNVDTGSSDLWVNTDDSSLCSENSQPCTSAGTYNANSSSTYEFVGSWFNITYADGSGASGDYVTDKLKIGGTTVKDFQFGIGYDSTTDSNILGIGYPSNEAQIAVAGKSTYKNLPERLADDGVIASAAYSMWLNDLDSSEGNLLFGGVDQAQYEGELVTVPIVYTEGTTVSEFYITLTSVDLDGDTVGDNLGLAVLLDSGTTLTYLPTELTEIIYTAVGATYDESEGAAIVSCSLADTDANITFSFSDPATIQVPLNEMVLDVITTTGGPDGGVFDSTAAEDRDCLFGIAPSSSSYVLGDTFLRSAYVVFDMGNDEISLAQSKMNATDTKVVEIGSGENAVPSATDASDAASATDGLPTYSTATVVIGGDDDDDAAAGLVPSRQGLVGVMVLTILVGFGGLLA